MFGKKIILFLAVGLLIQVSGCASIIDGSNQQVTISSVPEGADVSINGTVVGKTPLTYLLKRSEGTIITIRKEGYKTIERPLSTDLNPTFWGNIILGGLFGSTTDSSTGASIQYTPGQFVFNLEES